MTMGPELSRLIGDYLAHVERACRLLRARLGLGGGENLLAAWMERKVPQKGQLDPPGTGTFSFHGIGCRVRFGDVVVDFDFGPGGRIDGFDAWRLSLFAETVASYAALANVDGLRKELESLEQAGELKRTPFALGSHLYYRADAPPFSGSSGSIPDNRQDT